MATFLKWLLLVAPVTIAKSTFNPARPPSIPLAVRSPYLSTWLPAGSDGGNGGYLAGEWSTFWNGAITGWAGLIRVDNTTFTWMGDPEPLPPPVNQTSFSYTSTRSMFTMDVGGLVTMNITFLSPVTPDNMLRQSMPVSYLNVEIQSADGNEHGVSIYTDISAEWTSGNRSQIAEWSYGAVQEVISTAGGRLLSDSTGGSIAYHKVWTQNPQEFSEANQQASWGHWFYVTSNVDGLTHQSGRDEDVRGQFISNGALDNSEDGDYRPIEDNYPVFGFANDLGLVGTTSVQSRFAINLMQENNIQLESSSGTRAIPSLWMSTFDNELAALSYFYHDYDHVDGSAKILDDQIAADSISAGGQDYLTLTSLAVRQAWGALQLCGDSSAQYIFLKEISSDGNIQTVDVIYPFHPIMLYMNPGWLKLLLDPLFINMETSDLWPLPYSIHDLGSSYPNATGHPDGNDEYMPLEESGNMLIMTLAYAQKTGDTDYLREHYHLLHQWTQWLIHNDSVIPFNQISTDDFAGSLANQTNLALKAVIAVQAGALIANMTGHAVDSMHFSSVAQNWTQLWQNNAINSEASPPHTTLSYGDDDSFSLLYNLYSDALLQTEIIPTSVYEMQSDFYPTAELEYGVPLDTRHGYTKNDWEMFCGAIASPSTSSMFISDIAKWINETSTDGPTTDLYDASTGAYSTGAGPFLARPAVGGWFSLLALNQTGIPLNRV